MKKNKDNYFGIVELIGSIVLQLIDSDRFDNKKYLNQKYLRANRISGFITILVFIIILIIFLF